MKFRKETDSMGEVQVPKDSYFGAQTQRAFENFTISDLRFQPVFIHSLALVKKYAAKVNEKLGLIDNKKAKVIITAADEVMAGRLRDQFIVDVFQTGSGTSTNMNMNEVIATRANEILTGQMKSKDPVHPNDHVNLCQSSNDVIPTVIHIAASKLVKNKMMPFLKLLKDELDKKTKDFMHIYKIGRTHLQDAVIMTLGDEFSGYTRQIDQAIDRMATVQKRLLLLALGGTAVGTGLNAHREFAGNVISLIADDTQIQFSESLNHFESQASCDTAVETSSMLKTIAVSMIKIANDIRWLASGPRCGLGEINIPALQPGSSIMPGKVNPVIPEAVIQACAQVIGNDTAITFGGLGGYFELNTMLPLIAYNLLQSIELISNAAELMANKCVSGITANQKRCEANIKESLAIVTSLVPHIGYDRAAEIAKKAYDEGRSIEKVALAENILPKDQLLAALYGELK
ncbi:MAG: class II fumarate hydratase [Deltaproteobacteria bacterium]|nr:class II fumarate hydratase [Deltaproteobacteria bacterium]